MDDLALLFKALADETRLKLLALLLARGELCVCDLMETLGISQSKASRHLRYLFHAGLLRDRRAAVWVYYRIAEELDDERRVLLEAVRTVTAGPRLSALNAALDAWLRRKGGAAACGEASCGAAPADPQ